MPTVNECPIGPLWLDPESGLIFQDGRQVDMAMLAKNVPAASLTVPQVASLQAQVSKYGNPGRIDQPLTVAYSGAPTVTISHTTTNIVSGVTVSKDNAAFEYLGVGIGTWGAVPTMNISNPSSGYMSVEFCLNTAGFDVVLNNQNSRVMVWINDQPAVSNHLQLTASGAAEFMNVDFGGARQNVRVRIDGFNMPFGGVVMGANDTIWPANNVAPIMAFGPGDSYTQGTGARGQSLNWAATMARCLGYRFWAEGIGSTGWNSASPNTPAERVAAKGLNSLVRRVAGVNTPATVDKSIVPLGYNDAGGNMTNAAAAFDAFWAAASKKPDLIIGPWTPQGTTANLTLVKGMLQARAAAYGIPYLDIDGIINMANEAVLTDTDNIHPTYAGHDFIGTRIAQLAVAAGYLQAVA